MKALKWILLLLFFSFKLNAQQVTKIVCCSDLSSKATIIINDGTNSGSASATNTNTATNGTFTFELSSSVNTSAGVYNSSGNLVRTLWSGNHYDTGCYSAQWDGLLDDGSQAPFGKYNIKVLTNNVQYTWEGVIGNTSTDLISNYTWHGDMPFDFCFLGNVCFVAGYYSEHGSTQKTFDVSDPNKLTDNGGYGMTSQSSSAICTDGDVVYWAGNDTYNDNSWVFGSYPANGADATKPQYPFSAGTDISPSLKASVDYPNAISITIGNPNAYITAIAVQKTGKFLFVSRNGMGQLQVLDKKTGALVQTLAYANIQGLACDGSGNLFFCYNNGLHKAAVNPDGSLTDSGVSFAGLVSPSAMAISPDYTTISVIDEGTQQVKSYATSATGAASPIWTLGQSGGYATSPYITNDRFMFQAPFISYQTNGSFWVLDRGNRRVQHFDANKNYIGQVSYLSSSRSSNVDQNKPARVFANLTEYERDYSKPLDNGRDGSWKQKANWGYGFPNYSSEFSGFKSVATLSNGHTYGIEAATCVLYDLTPTGLVNLGYMDCNTILEADGSLYGRHFIDNTHAVVTKRVLTGFSGNMPQWSAPVNVINTPDIAATDAPVYYINNTYGSSTNTSRYIFYDQNYGYDFGSGLRNLGYKFHLGSMKYGANAFDWQASPSTPGGYTGYYPADGSFDVQNSGHSENAKVFVNNRDIFYGVYSELYKNQYENNIWNHFYDDGLFVGSFGVQSEICQLTGDFSGFAGNAFGAMLAKKSTNDYYLYHCDESARGGVHSWHITNANSIVELPPIPITVGATITPVFSASDMMAGLPYASPFYGGFGWTVYPAACKRDAVYGDQYPNWKVGTSIKSDAKTDIDISWICDEPATNDLNAHYIQRALGANNTNNWTLKFLPLEASPRPGTLFEVVNQAGKILVQFRASGFDILANGQYLVNNNFYLQRRELLLFNEVTITDNAGQVTVNYCGQNVTLNSPFDAGANFNSPALFRVRLAGSGDGGKQIGAVKGLRFVAKP